MLSFPRSVCLFRFGVIFNAGLFGCGAFWVLLGWGVYGVVLNTVWLVLLSVWGNFVELYEFYQRLTVGVVLKNVLVRDWEFIGLCCEVCGLY